MVFTRTFWLNTAVIVMLYIYICYIYIYIYIHQIHQKILILIQFLMNRAHPIIFSNIFHSQNIIFLSSIWRLYCGIAMAKNILKLEIPLAVRVSDDISLKTYDISLLVVFYHSFFLLAYIFYKYIKIFRIQVKWIIHCQYLFIVNHFKQWAYIQKAKNWFFLQFQVKPR